MLYIHKKEISDMVNKEWDKLVDSNLHAIATQKLMGKIAQDLQVEDPDEVEELLKQNEIEDDEKNS